MDRELKKEVNLSDLPHRYVIHFSQQYKTFGQRVAGLIRTADWYSSRSCNSIDFFIPFGMVDNHTKGAMGGTKHEYF